MVVTLVMLTGNLGSYGGMTHNKGPVRLAGSECGLMPLLDANRLLVGTRKTYNHSNLLFGCSYSIGSLANPGQCVRECVCVFRLNRPTETYSHMGKG